MRSLYNIYLFLALTFAAVAGAQIVLDPNPARVAGHIPTTPAEQLAVTNINPNFGVNGGLYSPEGVAVDTSTSPPILYVADTGNNRILAWKSATSTTLTNLQAPYLIIGQPNSYTTLPSINGGLYFPTGLLVDPKGNLYVADSGNNRVLRYPKPFANSNASPDIVLGQPDKFTSSKPNQGGSLSATTICLGGACPGGAGTYVSSLTMDSSGNLFVADAGNRRVLRYPAASLTAGALDPPADLVIGQAGFTVLAGAMSVTDRNTLYIPAGLAFDSAGHLFVTDALNRLIVYPAQVSSAPANTMGIAAIRFAGIVSPTPPTATASTLLNPSGIVMIDNGPAVLDSGDNRLLIFDAFSSADWAVASGDTTLSTPPPAAIAVLGQGSSLTAFTTSAVNAGNPQACVAPCSAGSEVATFSNPVAAAVAGNGDLFVVDSGNNRVLVYPNAGQVAAATEVLGQSDFPYDSPNSIHGKEFNFGPVSSSSYDSMVAAGGYPPEPYDAGIAVAVDSSTGMPHLYISDPSNHRVLGFADARKAGPGVQADIVIGQPNMSSAVCNYGGVANPATEALPRQPTQSSLCYPTGLAADPSGNLFVADSSNGRVLRFPAPFAAGNSSQKANLVLGQSGFTGISNPQASQSVMMFPYGLVFDPARGLLVSDEAANRVLLFSMTNPTNGESASTVIGQPNFTSIGSSVLSSPHHIAEDSIAEVYVADAGHNQILIFNIPSGMSTDTPVNSFTGLSYPEAVWVNPNKVAGYNNDIWVGDSAYFLSRYPVPNPLVTGNTPLLTCRSALFCAAEVTGPVPGICTGSGLCELPAIAITQDSYGALYVADTSNRVAIHYPALSGTNGASFVCAMGCNLGGLKGSPSPPGLAPGAFGTLFPFAPFSPAVTATPNTVVPVPTTLGGVQVLISCASGITCPPAGQPTGGAFTQGFAYSPLTYVSSGQVNFVVPFEAPTSGTAQVVMVNASTSQVLGSGSLTMNAASPGFFVFNAASGQIPAAGQIAALNQNNTVNSATNMAQVSSYVQLFLTGQGLVPNAPPDGQGSTGALSTSSKPVVYIGGSQATVSYSGLAPGYPGLWQINVQVPQNPILPEGFPTNIFPVQVLYEGLTSNIPANNGNPSLATTIAIKAQ
jgi:uncharacterized protein (TIGR03437 family)